MFVHVKNKHQYCCQLFLLQPFGICVSNMEHRSESGLHRRRMTSDGSRRLKETHGRSALPQCSTAPDQQEVHAASLSSVMLQRLALALAKANLCIERHSTGVRPAAPGRPSSGRLVSCRSDAGSDWNRNVFYSKFAAKSTHTHTHFDGQFHLHPNMKVFSV